MKAAILGLGNMGSKIAEPILSSPHVREVIGVDPDPDCRERAREKYGVTTLVDLDTVLRDPDVKVVFIATPNQFHCELTLAALEAGKAVLCEKPIAANLEDAERMVAASEVYGGFLQIGFELRYSQLYLDVKERIAEGTIGEVLNSQCTYICSEFHGRHSWRNFANAGGMFGEKLSHYVDLPRWWIGSRVTEVYSVCAPNAVSYFETRDNYHTTCRFASGAVSHLTFMMAPAATLRQDPLQTHISLHADDGHELRYLIQGSKGAIETNVFGRRFRRWQFTDVPEGLLSTIVEDRRWVDDLNEDIRQVHNTSGQALDVIDRVANGRPPFTDPRDSLETMRLVFAAEESAEAQIPIALSKHETAISV